VLFRSYDDFGAVLDSSPELSGRIQSVGVYTSEGALLRSWANQSPASITDETLGTEDGQGRRYVEKVKTRTVVMLLRTSTLWPPPPRAAMRPPHPAAFPPDRGGFMDTLRHSEYIRLEVREAGFFRGAGLRGILYPASLALLALLILAGQRVLARNARYRSDLEAQKNLVILGTAASTLAHEIKNPLLAIRLQTSLLARSLPGGRPRELEVIDSEVERLTALTRRVGDYLRDPRGRPERIDLAELASEVARRLMGREALPSKPPIAKVFADPERLRSIIENLLRNALESGSPAEEVTMLAHAEGSTVVLEVLDRGRGLGELDKERAFDPFFTTKATGSGIGLAISRRFARATGGDVTLAMRGGGGTVATLRLPAAGKDVATKGEGYRNPPAEEPS
jgi:two-component system sensor histidine kinase HydH